MLAALEPSPTWAVIAETADRYGWDFVDLMFDRFDRFDPPTRRSTCGPGQRTTWANPRGLWIQDDHGQAWDPKSRPSATWKQIKDELLQQIDPAELRAEWDAYVRARGEWLPLSSAEIKAGWSSFKGTEEGRREISRAARAAYSVMYDARLTVKFHLVDLIKATAP